MPPLDQALSKLVTDLDERGLLETTLVMVSSEFGRTPKINNTAGRDHWPKVFSVMLAGGGVKANLIWSVDDPEGVGLLDILPARASKYHAVEALMKLRGFTYDNTVFCGDSGNDIEVLASPIPAVLVANGQPDVRELARRLADEMGHGDRLYIARGNFMGMNGNYSAGMLEGIAHYHPQTLDWMTFETLEGKI